MMLFGGAQRVAGWPRPKDFQDELETLQNHALGGTASQHREPNHERGATPDGKAPTAGYDEWWGEN